MESNTVSGTKIDVLVERMNNYLDGQKRIEGQLSMLVQVQLAQESMRSDIKTVQRVQTDLIEKTEHIVEDLEPLRDEMIGNRRGLRVLMLVGAGILTISGALLSQWKPWGEDLARAKQVRDDQLAKYQTDIGTEMRHTDNRLTVLEFRTGTLETTKGIK